MTPHDLIVGFHVFLYNMEIRKEQPTTAAMRATNATGYEFFCYDRVEIDDEVAGLMESVHPGIATATAVKPSVDQT